MMSKRFFCVLVIATLADISQAVAKCRSVVAACTGPPGPRGRSAIALAESALQNASLVLATPASATNIPGLQLEFQTSAQTTSLYVSTEGALTLVPFVPPTNASLLVTVRVWVDSVESLVSRSYLLMGALPVTSIAQWSIAHVHSTALSAGQHTVLVTAETSTPLLPGVAASQVEVGDDFASSTARGVLSILVFSLS